MFHAGILCCAGIQINIQTFHVEFFRSLVVHCRILRSSFIGIYALPLASLLVSPSDFDVSKTCRDQRSWRFFGDLCARIGLIRR